MAINHETGTGEGLFELRPAVVRADNGNLRHVEEREIEVPSKLMEDLSFGLPADQSPINYVLTKTVQYERVDLHDEGYGATVGAIANLTLTVKKWRHHTPARIDLTAQGDVIAINYSSFGPFQLWFDFIGDEVVAYYTWSSELNLHCGTGGYHFTNFKQETNTDWFSKWTDTHLSPFTDLRTYRCY
ncbi:hypothetical protein AB0D59_17940 [Streptomyces sp. NPDC048417]|uniref:hypothetical protein n=1 Tax=Streptomyces sp. NPDC048417 TaxID=3155387 RepID=UPI0034361C10